MINEKTRCRIPMFMYNKQKVREKYLFNEDLTLDIMWLQIIFKSEEGEISLIHLGFGELYKENPWEIMCLKGKLLEDVERYSSIIEVIRRIEYLLGSSYSIKKDMLK